jgi:hypothetical protein
MQSTPPVMHVAIADRDELARTSAPNSSSLCSADSAVVVFATPLHQRDTILRTRSHHVPAERQLPAKCKMRSVEGWAQMRGYDVACVRCCDRYLAADHALDWSLQRRGCRIPSLSALPAAVDPAKNESAALWTAGLHTRTAKARQARARQAFQPSLRRRLWSSGRRRSLDRQGHKGSRYLQADMETIFRQIVSL